MTVPPFRAPHHTASVAAIVGGGSNPRPGEASLAHRGVLFLDELAEFPRNALEALRQPLEDGYISVARVGGEARLPGTLPARRDDEPLSLRRRAAIPLPSARAPQPRLAAYRDKLSRALLDRFDLLVTVPRPRARELEAAPGEPSDAVRERVETARERARGEPLRRTRAANELLSRAVERLPLSARGRARVARVARSAACLAGAESVEPEHVAEALSFRSPTELRAR